MSIQDIVDFGQANTPADRYRPDPAKVLKGDPEQAVFNHYSSPCGQMNAGVWEGAVASGRSTIPSMNTARSSKVSPYCGTTMATPRRFGRATVL